MGHATKDRPEGRLVWFHAASVGESLSVLRLISHMGETDPDLSFLLTSGTATSAEIVAKRLPPRTVHQFAPLDSARYLKRFLSYWRPDAAVFVESELWPQMLSSTHDRDIPLALINARISRGSARNWNRFPSTAKFIASHFGLIHCQDVTTADYMHGFGADHAFTGQNLKSLSGPLPYDSAELDKLRELIGKRPFWLASSTHPGEDEVVLEAHAKLLQSRSDALLILVPRHPERANDIRSLISDQGFGVSQRSAKEKLSNQTAVYLADTLGETGLWYALAPLTCLCGSFSPVGGHNPYEPAYAGSCVLHGPLYANFAATYADLDASGGARQVEGAAELAKTLEHLLTDAKTLDEMRTNASAFAAAQEDVLDEFADTLSKSLGLR